MLVGFDLYSFTIILIDGTIMSLFYLAFMYAIVKEEGKKFEFKNFLIFRILFIIIFYVLLDPFGAFIDFIILWLLGMIPSLRRFLISLCKFKPLDLSNVNRDDFLRCTNCYRIINNYDRVCPGCGTPTDNYEALGICTKCHKPVKLGDEYCDNCGNDLKEHNSFIPMNPIPTSFDGNSNITTVQYAKKNDFNQMLLVDDQTLIKNFITKEMSKVNFNEEKGKLPKKLYKRKIILNILFTVLLFIFIILIFFHLDFWVYLISYIVLLITFMLGRRFSLINYLTKEIKSRPNEKISNIVISAKNDLVIDKSKYILIVGIILSILIPVIYFKEPRIFYEESEDKTGYIIRFYTLGITDNDKAIIPDKYKDKPIVGIKGNVFKNLRYLKEVHLPDTITEIGGYAFAHDTNLKKINIPKNLTYLGGGAFKYCESLENIYLPEGITEIKDDTFRNCTNLRTINIPDNVTRIGKSAFRECKNLSEIATTDQSRLVEIRSSAFRNCNNLIEITIPQNTIVDSSTFNNSKTSVKRYRKQVDNNLPTEEQLSTKEIPHIEENKTPTIKTNNTNELYSNIEYGQIVNFNKLNFKFNYKNLDVNNKIATLVFTNNGQERIIEYDLNLSPNLHYAYDNYEIFIKKSYKNSMFIDIYEMVPSLDGYKYYVNLNIRYNTLYEIRSDKIKSIIVKFENLNRIDDEKYSMDFVLSGDINKRITFTNKDNTFEGNNFFIRTSSLWNDSGYGVIYLN